MDTVQHSLLFAKLLRPKIAYDLKLIGTTLEVNIIHPDQDPVSKS